ncbi:MAG: MBL fold metallo-hydrolase [Candidatus Methanomethylicia archaeon]
MSKFTNENRLENQLKLMELKHSDISFIVFTHLHLDHVGQACLFKEYKTPFIAHLREISYAVLLFR